jgi:putative hydrolase of the HAD superfamily
MRFIDQFQALLFDMNGTFMFGHDRLSAKEDFFSTYRRLGGSVLSDSEVRDSVLKTCAGLRRDYDDPNRIETFPSLLDATIRYSDLPEDKAAAIASVIAAHEVGVVPPWAARTLLSLSASHPLAIVSNVWAPAGCWADALAISGATAAFQSQIFSSSFGVIKPSPRLFMEALNSLEVEASNALFIGDSIERDIRPAKKLGLTTVLISSHSSCAEADVTMSSIAQLMHRSDATRRARADGATDSYVSTADTE